MDEEAIGLYDYPPVAVAYELVEMGVEISGAGIVVAGAGPDADRGGGAEQAARRPLDADHEYERRPLHKSWFHPTRGLVTSTPIVRCGRVIFSDRSGSM